tara:strand:- start:1412 stop:1804 length:393 start_codon:yes stop_codon:yes gene_type:complete
MKYLNLKLFLLLVFFFATGCEIIGQEFITADNFKEKIAKDIVAVEFWVEWNSSNEFADLSNLSDCSKYRVDIGKYPGLQESYSITCMPTVIIFESGEEKERFKANIMFQLEADKKKVQKSIDTIMLAKFN